MKLKIAILLLLAAALAPSPPAFGLGGDHKDYAPGESISHPDNWPPRLVKLASLPSRVAGYFCNADDYLAFKGDTTGFQAFLDTCGALGEFAPTTLHIHKGKGSFQPLDKNKKPLPCDWQLDVINQHFRTTEPNQKGPMYSFELHVWLDGAVDFAAIKVPAAVKTIQEANPAEGLEFLAEIPALKAVSLKMSEAEFLDIVTKQKLSFEKDVKGETTSYLVHAKKGAAVNFGFQHGKCTGIRRLRD